jgi:hypothetical protein
MSAVDRAIITPLEQALSYVPGAQYPAVRLAMGFAAGSLFAYKVRPSVSYDSAGNPRPWIVTDSSNPEATIFPYWAWGVLPAVFFGVFV